MTNDHKKYTEQAKRGIQGEAFFESLVCKYAIPHRVVGPKDVGVDYFCEWVCGDKPTGILWIAQVKTVSDNSARIQHLGRADHYNDLEEYQIKGSRSEVDARTLAYWEGLGLPAFLFMVVWESREGQETLDCYYKRLTPVLTKTHKQKDLKFYKANAAHLFRAFADPEKQKGGFARDLFIDHIRWNYFKGSIAYVNPRSLGLRQFPESEATVLGDLFRDYAVQIRSTYAKTKGYLEDLECPPAVPSQSWAD